MDEDPNSNTRGQKRPKTIVEEIIKFDSLMLTLPTSSSFKSFWSSQVQAEFPLLFQSALKFNTICASSAPSESYFSIANYQVRKERSNLDSKTLRYEMIAKQIDKLNSILSVCK